MDQSLLSRWNGDRPLLEWHSLRSSSRSLRPRVARLLKRRTDLGPVAPRSLSSNQTRPFRLMQPKTNLNLKPWTLSSLIPYSVNFCRTLQPLTKIFSDRTKCGQIICRPLTGPKAHWINRARAKHKRDTLTMFVQLIMSMLLTKSLKIGTVLSTALLNQPFYKLEMSRIYRWHQLPPTGQLLKISNSKHILCFSCRHYHKIFWRGESYLASYVTIN